MGGGLDNMSIPFNYALRRRLMSSNAIPWVNWFTNSQWGSGYSRELDIALSAGDIILFRSTNARMGYSTSNIKGVFKASKAGTTVLSENNMKNGTLYTMPSAVTYITFTNNNTGGSSSGTLFDVVVDYKIIRASN